MEEQITLKDIMRQLQKMNVNIEYILQKIPRSDPGSGIWIRKSIEMDDKKYYICMCSNCHEEHKMSERYLQSHNYNYCPNCGAKLFHRFYNVEEDKYE